MEWTCLGHATWLVEVAGIRILFDPLLGETHHEGVFSPFPPRTIDAARLRPDLVVVTHRHLDHFDPPSLRALAVHRPIVVTPDVLVARAAERLGMDVCVLRPWETLPLDGALLVPTPSFCAVVEWGMVVATPDAVAWNQGDTELRSPSDVRAVTARVAGIVGRPGIDLAIARWQPLLEIAAMTGGSTGFPLAGYRAQLEVVAAVEARAVIPGASGSRYAPAHGWLDAFAYPVPESRFLRDLRRRCPSTPAWPARVGARWRVADGVEAMDDSDLVTVRDEPDPRRFAPWAVPEIRDAVGADPEVLERWVLDTLAPALGRAHPSMRMEGAVCFVLRVVFPELARDWTIRADGERTSVEVGFDDDYDVANAITASALAAVIEGRDHWGRALLGGELRSTNRAYRVAAGGVVPGAVAPIFLYYALGWDEAFERWVERQLG